MVQSLVYCCIALIVTEVGEQIFVSGQIGMLPSNLTLPEPKSLSMETALSFQHVHRILSALEDMFGCNTWKAQKQTVICWLVDYTHIPIFRKINDFITSVGPASQFPYVNQMLIVFRIRI